MLRFIGFTLGLFLVAPSLSARVAEPVSRSLGSPTDGRLLSGVRLGESATVRIMPSHRQGDVRYGLPQLVGLLERASKSVQKKFPGAVLSVGHLSRKGGGEVDRHHSHESGRDADVGFYLSDFRGGMHAPDHFVGFRSEEMKPTVKGVSFDEARNWAFVQALVTDSVRVSHIFVAAPLRARLLSYASKHGVPYAIRLRAALAMIEPKGALPHDDHFHVRIACPGGMQGCVEYPTRPTATKMVAKAKKGTRPHAPKPGPRPHTQAPPAAKPVPPPQAPPKTEPADTNPYAPEDENDPPAGAIVDDVDGPV